MPQTMTAASAEVDICEPWPAPKPPWPNHREPIREYRRYGERYDGSALLPTGTKYNPLTETGEYAEPGRLGAEIVMHQDQGYVRVLTTWGRSSRIPGDSFVIRHDQTCAVLGVFNVLGVRQPDGQMAGSVPNKKLAHWVYK